MSRNLTEGGTRAWLRVLFPSPLKQPLFLLRFDNPFPDCTVLWEWSVLVCCCWGNRFTEVGDFLQIPAAGEARAREPAARSEKMAVLFSHVLGCEHIVFAAKKQKVWPAQPGRPQGSGLVKTEGRGPCSCHTAELFELTAPAWPHCPMHKTRCLQDRGGGTPEVCLVLSRCIWHTLRFLATFSVPTRRCSSCLPAGEVPVCLCFLDTLYIRYS